MPAPLYTIKDWNTHFENNKSREREQCSWCPIPNKQDGLGYGLIMLEDDGISIYGAFVAVVLMASKQRRARGGHLTDTGKAEGRPLSAKELSVKTKVPANIIERMLFVTSSESIGWIECANEVPAECPPSALEEKGIEEKGNEENAPPNPPKGDAAKEIKEVVDHYNSTCSPMPKVIKVTKTRKSQIAARLRDVGKDDLIEAIERAARSTFLCGDNDRQWVADLEWITKESNFTKIIEGKYDNKQVQATQKPHLQVTHSKNPDDFRL